MGLVTVSIPASVLLSTESVCAVTLPVRPPPWRYLVKRSTPPFGGTPPYWVQPPSVSRIAGPNSISPETRSSVKWRSYSVEPTKSSRSSQRDQSPDSGSWISSVSPDAGLSTGELRSGKIWPGVPSETPTISRVIWEACVEGSRAPMTPAVIE